MNGPGYGNTLGLVRSVDAKNTVDGGASRMQLRLGYLQYAIIGLTLATAAIHFVLAPKAGWLFWLNGIGYLVLLGLLYWPASSLAPFRSLIRWIFITYTIITIVAWITFGVRSSIAYLDKTIEVLLVGLLWFEGQVAGRSTAPPGG
jgi:hypothetical protein